ncbi:LysR family transcriptional regulator [Goekera deserti]|uniref:LysR family transcriptional regulator n=1 Tax=Goekera deserti TaxID=2497753 RepID=UPI00192E9266|nr:LysR family transcriptional regulator [Goekera deserti]
MTESTSAGHRTGGAQPSSGVPRSTSLALRSQDLVSLPVLHARLHERNVTRAGESMGMSQPAASAVLARLRRRFGDQLLVRVGRGYELTPLAASLLDRLDVAVQALERLFGQDFDPASSTRDFVLVASDYVPAVLGEELNRIMAEEAPGVGLDLRPLTTTALLDMDATLRQADGVVMPHEMIHGYPGNVLLRDRWVCIVAQSNTAVGDELRIDHLAVLPWAAQYSRLDPGGTPALRQLRALGIEPHVEVVTEGFLAVPFLVAGSNRIAFLQERLAQRCAATAPVRVLPSPVEVGDLAVSLRWHPGATDDPGSRWFRGVLQRAAARLDQAITG